MRTALGFERNSSELATSVDDKANVEKQRMPGEHGLLNGVHLEYGRQPI